MNTLPAPIRAARVSLAGAVRGGRAPSLRSRRCRVAFTLVEVLVVVVILGLVFSLIIGGLGAVTNSARNATVESELYQLDSALQQYSGLYGELPPTMLTSYTAASPSFDHPEFLNQVFARHVRRTFPRYNGYYGDIEKAINHATVPDNPGGYVPAVGCDVQNIDAAESLVFWLGGLPRIIWATAERYEVELTGFAADPSAPLLPKVDQPKRTKMLFDFDRRRLVDSDMDGWPEYVPDFDGAGPGTPPYVYFDAGSYTMLPSHPVEWHPAMSSAADNWGFARPYLKTYTPNDPEQHPLASDFAAADRFQLICAGADQKYAQLDATTALALGEAKNELTVYPRGQSTVRGSTTWQPIAAAEYDNLANFLDSTLEHALGAPQ